MSSNGYISLPVNTDVDTLVQKALTNVANSAPGWVPREGNLEVVLLEEIAQMVTEAADVASQMPVEAFKYYGTLVGIPPLVGASAQVYTTWTLNSPAPSGGTTIPKGSQAGTVVNNISYVFTLNNDLVFTSGSSSVSNVLMTAYEPGANYNNVTAGTYFNLSQSRPDIASVLVTIAPGDSSGGITATAGTDSESTSAYLDRLSYQLTLMAPRPILAADFARLAQNVSGVYRATALDGVNPYNNILSAADARPTSSNTWTVSPTGTATTSAGTSGLTVTFGTGTLSYALATPTSGTTYASSGNRYVNIAGDISSTMSAGQVLGLAGYTSSIIQTQTSSSITVAASIASFAVLSTASFSTTGTFSVPTSGSTWAVFAYTGKTSSALTGCTLINGVVGANISNNAWVTQKNFVETVGIQAVGIKLSGSSGSTTATVTNSAIPQPNSTLPMTLSGTGIASGTNIVSYNAATQTVTLSAALTANVTSSTAITTTYNGNTVTYLTLASNLQNSYISGDHSYVPLCGLAKGIVLGTFSNVTSNANYQAEAIMQNVQVGGVNSWGVPVLSVKALYNDGTVEVFTSNLNAPLDYTDYSSFLTTNVDAIADGSGNYPFVTSLLGGATVAGQPSLNARVSSLTIGIYWSRAAATSQHLVKYAGLSQSFGSRTNLVPDAILASYSSSYPNASWTFDNSGNSPYAPAQAVPGVGLQYVSPTSLGSSGNSYAYSPYFNLPAGSYTLAAYVNAPSIAANGVNFDVVNSSGTSLSGGGYTFNPSNNPSLSGYAAVNFTVPAGGDCQVKITFQTGLTLPVNGVVAVSQVQINSGTNNASTYLNSSYLPSVNWTAGGNSSPVSLNSAAREVTVVPMQSDGSPVTANTLKALQSYLDGAREANFQVNVINPTYVPIDIQWSAKAALGYDTASVTAAGNTALETYLSPAYFGGGTNSPPIWDSNQNYVRYLDLAGYLDDVEGIANIISLTVRVAGGTFGTSDISLGNLGGIPVVHSVTGTVTSSTSAAYEVG